jgi:hypothetical protein
VSSEGPQVRLYVMNEEVSGPAMRAAEPVTHPDHLLSREL